MALASFFIKRRSVYFSLATIVLFGMVFGLVAVDYADEMELAAAPGQPEIAPKGEVSIKISEPARSLDVYSDGELYKRYRIAVGERETPSPVGEWKVVWKDYNWGTGFGSRWMGLNVPWGTYGIHGTNKPWSIGRYASHGCIRMRNRDVEELFEWVPIGTQVKIEGPAVKVKRTLRYKTSGADVVVVQIKLKELGYFEGRADGIFGLQTEEAVRKFQEAMGINPHGIVNKETLSVLDL